MFVKLKHAVFGAVLISVGSAGTVQASEWGCEVMLCASSSNPSWRGVAACHPPMTRLISAMKRPGFDWPTCPEAGTGAPGYERYAECPAGYQVGHSQNRNGFSAEGDLCVKTVNICQANAHGLFNSDRQQGCTQTISVNRPLRPEPYFFDIKNDTSGKIERHWFGLHK